MIPKMFGKLGKNKTPEAAIILCGIACVAAPFLEEAFWYGWLMLHLLAVLLPICSYLFPSVFSEKETGDGKAL